MIACQKFFTDGIDILLIPLILGQKKGREIISACVLDKKWEE
jgi:hypothetical protein